MTGFDTALAEAVEERAWFVDGNHGRSAELAPGMRQLKDLLLMAVQRTSPCQEQDRRRDRGRRCPVDRAVARHGKGLGFEWRDDIWRII